MKPLVLLILLSFLAACEKSGNLDRKAGRDDIIQVEDDDAEMEAAMQQGRDSFLALSKTGLPSDLLVKAYFFDDSEPDDGEHMWVSDVTVDGKTISGILASQPSDIPSLKASDSVEFPVDRLSDWMNIKNGVAQGAFTVNLLRSRMSPSELADHDSGYLFKFE